MSVISISLENGIDTTYELPVQSNINSFWCCGLHKSGSTLLTNMIAQACEAASISCANLPEALFIKGLDVDSIKRIDDDFFQETGYAYLGARTPWFQSFSFDPTRYRWILLIRDPRDALVSQYFSFKYSHPLPDEGEAREKLLDAQETLQNMTIDQFVSDPARINRCKAVLADYLRVIPTSRCRIYRYEDVIFFKREWLEDMLDFLSISIPSETVADIAKNQDIIPEEENPLGHIRQVVPGNYRKHLSQTVIDALTDQFANELQICGYLRPAHLKDLSINSFGHSLP